ncbi:Blue-light-activated protein [Thiorhodovibrio winogradskyi]|uniref:histidine kinase n=1 Tax=Thiorhodovibrio winogradskyi TaxID=77007 RepID=A0ABZ0S6I9_9GAMM|nr:PAS domain-containing protein [Thiorhodovibrio winogradskyi]
MSRPSPAPEVSRWRQLGLQGLATLALALVAEGANSVPIPLFFGVDLLPGSIIALIALVWLGTLPALVVVAAGGLMTLPLWGHPYALIIFSVEIACVAAVRDRIHSRGGKQPPLPVIDLGFWLLLGIPMVLFFYHQALALPWEQTRLIAIKQSLNGVLNAAVAGIMLLLVDVLRRKRASVRLADLVFNGLLVAVVLPALLLVLANNRQLISELEDRVTEHLGLFARLSEAELRSGHSTAESSGQQLGHLTRALESTLPAGSALAVELVPRREVDAANETPGLHLQPATDPTRSRMQSFRGGRYHWIQPLATDLPWSHLRVSLNAAPVIDEAQARTADAMLLLALIVLSTLVLTGLGSRWTDRAIERLLNAIARVPVAARHGAPWQLPPTGSLEEWDRLRDSIRGMASSLQQMLREVRDEHQKGLETLARLREQDALLARAEQIAELGSWSFSRQEHEPQDAKRQLRWSEQLHAMLGYAPGDVERSWPALFARLTDVDRQALKRGLRALLDQSQVVLHLDVRVAAPGQSIRVLETYTRAVRNTAGRLLGLEGVGLDVTERRAIERALAEERRFIANVIAGTRLGTWSWYVQIGKVKFNEHWAAICGYTLAELMPLSIATWRRLAHPDDLEISDVLMDYHLRGHVDRYECEVRMRHRDGHWVWVLDQGRVVEWSSDGEPLIVAGTHTDVSQRKGVEQRIAEREALEQELVALAASLVNTTANNLDAAINAALQRIGAFWRIDRSYLFLLDAAEQRMSNTHEWVADGVAPMIDMLQQLPIDLFPAAMNRLATNQPVVLQDIHNLPDEWAGERAILEPQAIQSLLLMPLHSAGRLQGFVGFDAVSAPRRWSESELRFLRVFANLLASALGREQFYAALRLSEERLARYSRQLEELIAVSLHQSEAADQGERLLELGRVSLGAVAGSFGTLDTEKHYHPLFMAGTQAAATATALGAASLSPDNRQAEALRLLGASELPAAARAHGIDSALVLHIPTNPDTKGEFSYLLVLCHADARAGVAKLERQLLQLIGQRLAGIERHRRIQQDLVTARERATIGHLASGIAHDFNNLLGAIDANLWYLNSHLLMPAPDSETAEILQETISVLNHAKVITSGLLSLSHHGGIPLAEVVLSETIPELARILSQILPPSMTLEVAVEPQLRVLSNGAFLQAALLNLAINARDATGGDGHLRLIARRLAPGTERAVRLGQRPVGDLVEILVEDDGCGMDAPTLARIFEPLFSTKSAQRGHGLGLFMVQEFFTRTKGALALESTPEIGTAFRLLLPAVASPRQAAVDCDNALPKASPQQEIRSINDIGIPRVVVVDDERSVREAVGRLLTAHGMAPELAEHGAAALERLKRAPPVDLVLTDYAMPRLDGIGLLQRIDQEHPDLPVIFMTGETLESLREKAASASSRSPRILAKPLDANLLCQAIRAATSARVAD